ncbi:LapA family protein [Limosilactobacillus sp.]|uniref:LapA family protein n=1 Tax=Limosilactobacillus sp. TaxID=2773925 RepID=UPI0025B7BD4B|nr:lipopolysaccharide assembly protein LapA domain-containing protein [Limosilactobacillus sp.]MCH3922636.1 lipopolysaccharide assembly protein LapA domain-containing protein [Limosilactobacillus sp.]MCH3927319.1 lipopolysaccharide assembly protein LapA domain-containing protein [Limosilactobacillus sp.]
MKKQSTLIVSIILLIVFVIFALLNTATVKVNLLFGTVKTPLVLLILICMLIGALIIYLLSWTNHLKVTKELKALRESKVSPKEVAKLRQQIDRLQKENARLKAPAAAKPITTHPAESSQPAKSAQP